MSNLYGLIFDVDGVIADTEPYNARATIKVFEDLFGVKGVQRKDFNAGLGRGAEEYVKAAARIHGLDLTEDQVKKAVLQRQENFLKILASEPLSAFDGVLDLMNAALSRNDFKLAIVTSSSRQISEPTLCSAKIPYEKMAYITGDKVTYKKPDPQLFLLAAEAIGIEPVRCVVIEDAPDGVQAAKAAGANCIAVTNSASFENLRKADLVCDSLLKINIGMITKLIDFGKAAARTS